MGSNNNPIELQSVRVKPSDEQVKRAEVTDAEPLARYLYSGRNDDIGQIMLVLKQLGVESGAIVGRLSDDNRQMMSGIELLQKMLETMPPQSNNLFPIANR